MDGFYFDRAAAPVRTAHVKDRYHGRAVSLLIGAALCWSIAGVLIKYVAWPAMAVAGARGLLAAGFLAVFARPLRFTWSGQQIAAAVAYAACTITFVAANKLTTAANAILLQYTAPIYVALLSARFLGERIRRADWITLLVVLLGMILFFADELSFGHAAGNLTAIASGMCFAAMTLLLRKEKDASPVTAIVLGNVIAGIVGLPWMLHLPQLEPTGYAALLILGFAQLGLSYLLYARAVPHVTALELVLIPILEPILNPLWTWLVYREKPGAWAFAGAALVISGVVANALTRLRDNRSETTTVKPVR
jgi:drug/metabolite transporter (DMT)-like permease